MEKFLLEFEKAALWQDSYVKPCQLKIDEGYKVLRFRKHGHVDYDGNQALIAMLAVDKHVILPRRLTKIVNSDAKLNQLNKEFYCLKGPQQLLRILNCYCLMGSSTA